MNSSLAAYPDSCSLVPWSLVPWAW